VLLLIINEKGEPPAARNMRGRKPKLAQTKQAKAKADPNLALIKVKEKPTGKKKASVPASHSTPEVDPNDKIPFYHPASKEEYFRLREKLEATGSLFRAIEGDGDEGDPDWINFPPKALYTARPGPASTQAKRRLERLAQYMSYMVLSIAHDDGITREKAWELTGLLKSETRGPNMYNAFSHWRAGQLSVDNGDVPGKCLL
jgi:hypothetical protein